MWSCRLKLTFLSTPHKAVRNDWDMILIFGTIPGQEAGDGCPYGKFGRGDFAYTGRKHDGLADGEFVAHRRGWALPSRS